MAERLRFSGLNTENTVSGDTFVHAARNERKELKMNNGNTSTVVADMPSDAQFTQKRSLNVFETISQSREILALLDTVSGYTISEYTHKGAIPIYVLVSRVTSQEEIAEIRVALNHHNGLVAA